MHHEETKSNQEDSLYNCDIILLTDWNCLNILLSFFELNVLQNCRIQVTKNSFMKKKHYKFKLSVLKVQSINQHITDNLLLFWFKQLNVRMKFIKNESFTVNGITISINLYSEVLGDLLILDWEVQLITGRVQRRSHDKVDKDLKKIVNQNNRKNGILLKISTAEEQSVWRCLTREGLEKEKSS